MDSFPMTLKGEAMRTVVGVVNEGIDARLEAFTRSTFDLHHCGCIECRVGGPRLECEVHPAEMTILLRRLVERWENGDEEAGTLADDIVDVAYMGEEN